MFHLGDIHLGDVSSRDREQRNPGTHRALSARTFLLQRGRFSQKIECALKRSACGDFSMLRKLLLCLASVAAAGVASAAVIVVDPVTNADSQVVPSTVNRNLKGDMLPMKVAQVPISQSRNSVDRNTSVPLTKPKEAPVGCDPAFSPVASPSLSYVFGRCMT
jgi:hypothetical protein